VETFHTYNYFVQVILPLALPKTYTYAVPVHLEELIQTGVRVEVQFGRQKLYTAIVHAITQQAPVEYVPKAILSVVDEQPIVTQSQLDFWQWIASYYMCTLGDVMQAALPAFFKLDSETFFVKNPDNESDILDLTDDEYMIAEALNHQEQISLKDIFDILQKKTVSKPVKSLLSKRIMYVKETLHEKYTPKTEMFVELSPQYTVNGLPIKEVFDIVSKYPNQENLLLAYIELSKKKILSEERNYLRKLALQVKY
jgi:primosomal protein N' (replication factor Y)